MDDPPRRFGRRWLAAGSLLFSLGVLWGLSSPIPSGPDETAQVIKAVAVAHGTLVGHPQHHGNAATIDVEIPSELLSTLRERLCDYQPQYPAGCPIQALHLRRAETLTSTYVGRYPPLYYSLTGWPTLLLHGAAALRAIRVLDAAIVAILLGLAFAVTTAYSRSGLRVVALCLGVTPTVLYLGGVVNPSGMEIAGAAVLWSALAVAVFDRPDDVPRAVVAAATVGALAICASRNLSPLICALILLTVAASRPSAARRVLAQRRSLVAGAVIVAGAVACGIFVLVAKSYKIEAFPLPGHPGLAGAFVDILRRLPAFVTGTVGGFGAPNVLVPVGITVVWLALVVGLLGGALAAVPVRDRVVLVAVLLLLGFVIPGIVVISHVKVDGIAWESRYSLPLISGIPLLAAGMLEEARGRLPVATLRAVADVVAVVTAVATALSGYILLRRYTVGDRPDRPNAFATTIPDRWVPPLPAPLLYALLVAATAAWAWWWRRRVLQAAGRQAPAEAEQLAPTG